MQFSDRLFTGMPTVGLRLRPEALERARDLEARSLAGLIASELDGIEYGSLVLPTVRWVLRRHDLEDSQAVRDLVRRYVRSAVSLHLEFKELVERRRPRAMVVFNGIMFPEAVARWSRSQGTGHHP
jgi:hypothetical protein